MQHEAQAPQSQQPKGAPSPGVRKLGVYDIAPDCEIIINDKVYELEKIVKDKKVVDIGCGFGRLRKVVEAAGGEWIGVEPFEGGAHTVKGDAENLPFPDNTFDIAIMHAVLEHVPDAAKSFKEVARVLKPGGIFVGYSAFMECFHEISYSHLSFKALEHFANVNGMKLERIGGGGEFGISYHLGVILYPIKMAWLLKFISWKIRMIFLLKSKVAYWGLRLKRKEDKETARKKAELYYKVECLRQSIGFSFVIRKR